MANLEMIMLIDDSDADNFYHNMVIKRSGIKSSVQSIASSYEALAYLEKGILANDGSEHPLPQLIFLDINMPAMNGFELLQKLRDMPDPSSRKKDIKIFMLTGSLNPDDKAMATEQFGDMVAGFRIKPLTDAVVLEIVAQYFAS